MSPWICQLLIKGEIKLPVLLEGDILPAVHKFYQPIRQNIYAILFNLYHARFDRRQQEDKIKGMRRKADELRRTAKQESTGSYIFYNFFKNHILHLSRFLFYIRIIL